MNTHLPVYTTTTTAAASSSAAAASTPSSSSSSPSLPPSSSSTLSPFSPHSTPHPIDLSTLDSGDPSASLLSLYSSHLSRLLPELAKAKAHGDSLALTVHRLQTACIDTEKHAQLVEQENQRLKKALKAAQNQQNNASSPSPSSSSSSSSSASLSFRHVFYHNLSTATFLTTYKLIERGIIQAEAIPNVARSGYLQARTQASPTAIQHRQFFVLLGNVMYYFNKRDSVQPKGILQLAGARCSLVDRQAGTFLLQIRVPDSHRLWLTASGEKAMQEWVAAVGQASIKRLTLENLVDPPPNTQERALSFDEEQFITECVATVCSVGSVAPLAHQRMAKLLAGPIAASALLARLLNIQRCESQRVMNLQPFQMLIEWLNLSLLSCYESGRHGITRSLMNMCNTFYYEQLIQPPYSSSSSSPPSSIRREYLSDYLRDHKIWFDVDVWVSMFIEAVAIEREKQDNQQQQEQEQEGQQGQEEKEEDAQQHGQLDQSQSQSDSASASDAASATAVAPSLAGLGDGNGHDNDNSALINDSTVSDPLSPIDPSNPVADPSDVSEPSDRTDASEPAGHDEPPLLAGLHSASPSFLVADGLPSSDTLADMTDIRFFPTASTANASPSSSSPSLSSSPSSSALHASSLFSRTDFLNLCFGQLIGFISEMFSFRLSNALVSQFLLRICVALQMPDDQRIMLFRQLKHEYLSKGKGQGKN